MTPPRCFDNVSLPIVLDASGIINLNATGCAPEIINVIPNQVLVVDIVREELNAGGGRGRPDADLTARLIQEGYITVVKLEKAGRSVYEQLISGGGKETLDDGEAATIAHALELDAIALIDERKATRLCSKRFANLALASTVDLLAHPHVQSALGHEALAEAVFMALLNARMSVQSHHVEWVANLIGPVKTTQCRSLPNAIRSWCASQVSGLETI